MLGGARVQGREAGLMCQGEEIAGVSQCQGSILKWLNLKDPTSSDVQDPPNSTRTESCVNFPRKPFVYPGCT